MQKETLKKARADARPKKFLTLAGHEITVDERNWIVKKGYTPYYFATIDQALFHIAEQEERSITTDSWEKLASEIDKLHVGLLKEFVDALHRVGIELPAKSYKATKTS